MTEPDTQPAVGSVDRILTAVRSGLRRVSPAEAARIQEAGGLLVDIRPSELRAAEGEVPGALVIDRNVLEWRLDPTGAHRHPEAGPPDRDVVVFCQEGYASSFAVESLLRIGLRRVSDLEGGYEAWLRAGRPVIRASRP
jgi:rhodanese-related sulfurtransferase